MIVAQTTVARIVAMLPPGCLEAVTLGSRQSEESGYTSVSYAVARRKPASSMEMMLTGGQMGQPWITFQLFKQTETTDPKIGDRITDASSVVWQVKKIKSKMIGRIFDCLCLRNA